VAASSIPVISAVGHESDWTLIDLVADMRAPTPTGAAEIAVPVKADLEATVANLSARLRACMSRSVVRRRHILRAAARALPTADQLLALPRRRFDEATSRLGRVLVINTERKRARLGALRLSPAILSRRVREARKTILRDLSRAQAALRGRLREHKARFSRTSARLRPEPIARRQKLRREALTTLSRRHDQSIGLRIERLRNRVTQAERLLSTLSHQAVLERGFALVSDAGGTLVKRAAEVSPGAALTLRFADGTADAVATGAERRLKPASKPQPKAKDPGSQGSLF
jgi:exodeoxyribonuclease VII large subunit